MTSLVQLSLHLIYIVANSKPSCFISRSITQTSSQMKSAIRTLAGVNLWVREGIRVNCDAHFNIGCSL